MRLPARSLQPDTPTHPKDRSRLLGHNLTQDWTPSHTLKRKEPRRILKLTILQFLPTPDTFSSGIFTDTTHKAGSDYHYRYLTQDIHRELQFKLNTLVRGHNYESLKKILTERYSETPEQQLDKLCKNLEMGSKRSSDFLAEMQSLAQGRVPRDTVISLWRTRLPAQVQVMVMNYKEEIELLKCADMAYDLLQ